MPGRRPSRPAAGTLGDVIERWRLSPAWTNLKPTSKTRYLSLLAHVQSLAKLDVTAIRRRHVLQLRDQFAAEAPATANGLVSLLSIILGFAVEREYVETNVAFKIPKPKLGRHSRWSDAQIAFFLEHARKGARRAGLLAMETGQRRGDLLAATWSQWDGETFKVEQQKTGRLVMLRASERLVTELTAWRLEARARSTPAVTILTNDRYGRPWTYAGFSASWDAEMKRLEALSDKLAAEIGGDRFAGLTFHGLRATHACWLLEAGASPAEVMACCGWESYKQLQHYTRDVDRKRQASAAIVKLDAFRHLATPKKERDAG